jgi:hypothetical protein
VRAHYLLLLCFGEVANASAWPALRAKQVEVLNDAVMRDGRHPRKNTGVPGLGLCFVFVNVGADLRQAPCLLLVNVRVRDVSFL